MPAKTLTIISSEEIDNVLSQTIQTISTMTNTTVTASATSRRFRISFGVCCCRTSSGTPASSVRAAMRLGDQIPADHPPTLTSPFSATIAASARAAR